MNERNESIECLKRLIIYTAQQYIEETDISPEGIMLIDNYADALLQNVEKAQRGINGQS